MKKLNIIYASLTSDLYSDHPNFICPFCTKIFNKKAEVVKHLDTFDDTEDLSAIILLSGMRKLKNISTTTTSLMKPPVFFAVSRFSKKRLRYRGINTKEFPMGLFCQEIFMSIENFVKHIVNHH